MSSRQDLSCVAIRRSDRFSPNSVEADRAILQLAACRLADLLPLAGEIPMVDEEAWAAHPVEADIYLSMGRCPATLQQLQRQEQAGRLVVNSAEGVMRCQRSVLDALMRSHHVAMPPATGHHGYWLKRGDAAAQSKSDVVFCPDEDALAAARQQFAQRGISDMVASAHVVGDLVKFYGVGQQFFRFFYPSDDGISKFGDEQRNGAAHHYAFSHADLHSEVVRLSALTGVTVYGGDAIIDADGRFYIIDFNDWPSFSRCREEAAEAIARQVEAEAGRKL